MNLQPLKGVRTLNPLKGFRDFYPPDMAFQSWFYENLKEVSLSFGFEEYEGPTIELLDLYAAKSGEELVKKQAFTLEDKSGQILALRPEMTPSLARMIAQKENSLVFPAKWFTYGRRFRYEQPQKGRGREFFQWDVDILGSDSPAADAEIITIAATFYQKIGLTPAEVKIKINDREYLKQKLLSIGIGENQFMSVLKIIDKKAKVTSQVFIEMLTEIGLTQPVINNLLPIFDDRTGYKESDWLNQIFEILKLSDIGDYVEFDASIVRGLDYYTRTVFEGWVTGGQFRSIWGGGRYDNLTQQVGGKNKITGVGFAMGDMVMSELLISLGKYPKLNPLKTKILVTIFSPDLFLKSLSLSQILRSQGIETELYPDPNVKLDKQLKYASRKCIPYVAILGSEEISSNTFKIKNMQTSEQQILSTSQLSNLTDQLKN